MVSHVVNALPVGAPQITESALISGQTAQGPYFQLVPEVTFEGMLRYDFTGATFIRINAVVKWSQDIAEYIHAVSPNPPTIAEIPIAGRESIGIDLSKDITDIGVLSGNETAHIFRVRFPKIIQSEPFELSEVEKAAKFIRGINKMNVELAKWQKTAINATNKEFAIISKMPEQAATGELSDYLIIGDPKVQGQSYYPTMKEYGRVVRALEKELGVSKSQNTISSYRAMTFVDNDARLSVKSASYAQLADEATGAKPDTVILGSNHGAAIEHNIADDLSAKPSKISVKPPLPEGLNGTIPALNKLKNAVVEHGPNVASGIILAGGAYLTQKQMVEYSRAGRPDKAVGLGTGYTAAVMLTGPIATTCAPSAAGGWTYLGCVVLGTMGINGAVENLSGRFASWYLENEKKYQPPIPENVKENIKHPITAIKKAFHP
jgi:hypothetical protein